MAKMKIKQIDNNNAGDGSIPISDGNTNKWSKDSKIGIRLPSGTTEERPLNPSVGMFRYNTDTNNNEFYNGTAWVSASGGSSLLGMPTDNSWIDGLNGKDPAVLDFTSTTKVADAIDKLNEVMGLLLPAKPPTFPNASLSIINTTGNTPKLANGVTENNTGQGTIPAAGSSVLRVEANTITTNTFTGNGPGTEGTLTCYINGAKDGELTFTSTVGQTYNQTLNVSNDIWYPPATPGFWQSFEAYVQKTNIPLGYNRVSLIHSLGGSTGDLYFVRDSLTANPAVINGTISENVAGTYAYSSGVPHYNSGSPSLKISGCQMNNLSGLCYYGGTDPLTISSTNSICSSKTFDYTTLGFTVPLAKDQTSYSNLSDLIVPIDGSVHNTGTLSATPKNVHGVGSSTSITGTILVQALGASISGNIVEQSKTIAVTGGNITLKRFAIDSNSTTPNVNGPSLLSSYSFNSGTSVGNGDVSNSNNEAVIYGGKVRGIQTDMTTSYWPHGPNFSGKPGTQFATFIFNNTNGLSTMTITITGATPSSLHVKMSGHPNNNNGSLLQTNNGWMDAKSSITFAPGQYPGSSGTPTIGCLASQSSNTYNLDFGSMNSVNATDHIIMVRIGLTVGSVIDNITISNINA